MTFKAVSVALASLGLVLSITSANAQFVGSPNAPAQGAQSGFQGPGDIYNTVLTTVRQVIDRGYDDQRVQLEGNIVQQIGKELYIFQDATGQIRVDIDHKYFRGQVVTPQDRVRIVGELDKDLFEPIEIDVKYLTLLK